MSLLNRDELASLMEVTAETAVSIYLPAHRSGPDIRQDPIRLKNLLASAESKLLDGGMSKRDVQELLSEPSALVEDRHFWRHQSDGLALFVAAELFRHYRLPIAFEELAVVSDRFHLKPLLPLLTGDGRFFVLALSQNHVRVLEATRDRVSEVDLGEAMPKSLADAVGYDWEQRSLQFHTGAPRTGASRRAAMFHGQGSGRDDEQPEIEQFLRRLDAALTEMLGGEETPLVLAAAEPLRGEFRKISGAPQLVPEAIEGNPDELSAEELHEKAWQLVEPLFHREQELGARRFRELEGTGKAVRDVREIVTAAHDGRIDVLFVPLGVQRWGSFDPEARDVELHDDAESGDQDLLNLAALESLAHGGTVYAIPPAEMPAEGDGAAAILRY